MRIYQRARRLLLLHAEHFYFNVQLGHGAPAPAETSAALRDMWRRSTVKRADLVADYGDRWELVELRHDATSSAVGRLLQYRMLWQEDPPDQRPLSLTLATDSNDTDLYRLCAQLKISLILAPPPPQITRRYEP